MEKSKNKGIVPRPPIITIMGHIDHGKSTLLDYIRKSNIVGGESGGITQHLSAYEVIHPAKEGGTKTITFLDTPGHQAFSNMRSRGANIADIAVLVVSAEDGVKQQTTEALKCIKDAEIPYIVAITKIDKPNANVERVKQDLAEHEIYIEGYGGEVPCIPISAKSGAGVPELLDMMLLVAELAELKGDKTKPAEGVVIESSLNPKRGISATLIVEDGTLKKGSFIVAEDSVAPVRMMESFLGKNIDEASFSSPIRITGWQKIPTIGAPFKTYLSKKEAEAEVESYLSWMRAKTQKTKTFKTEMPEGEEGTEEIKVVTIPLIIKTDVVGTLEAIEKEIGNLDTEKVKIKLVQKGVGTISENDIKTVAGSQEPIIIGFHVSVDGSVPQLAERYGAIVKTFDIIYKITEWLQEEIARRTPKIETEEMTGQAEILKVFSKNKNKQVIGGRVSKGVLKIKSIVKIIRREHEIGRGKILELQRQKLAADEVIEGNEFGTMIDSKIEIARGDVIESFVIVQK
ncbi:MAG: translation initiation factor IF-2 [Candidatus Yonathbacteria bacterium]|nr:translation initiation factor IF-2 [Candidatus Yonathbacteria bacterium]